jgi:hypothetical protein
LVKEWRQKRAGSLKTAEGRITNLLDASVNCTGLVTGVGIFKHLERARILGVGWPNQSHFSPEMEFVQYRQQINKLIKFAK